MLLVPSRTGTLYAFSTKDGQLLWKHPGNLKYNTKVIVKDPYLLIGGWNFDFFVSVWMEVLIGNIELHSGS